MVTFEANVVSFVPNVVSFVPNVVSSAPNVVRAGFGVTLSLIAVAWSLMILITIATDQCSSAPNHSFHSGVEMWERLMSATVRVPQLPMTSLSSP